MISKSKYFDDWGGKLQKIMRGRRETVECFAFQEESG
jgi:hypothetical protein